MVFHCAEANQGRYNCIVENSITAKTVDSTNDTLVETAAKINKQNQLMKFKHYNLHNLEFVRFFAILDTHTLSPTEFILLDKRMNSNLF